MWLKRFKIAIVQKDIEAIDTLLSEIPSFETRQEMEEAAWLTKEALSLMTTLQDENEKSLQQLRKNREFLKSTQDERPSRFDIKS
jgi:hypothetical protein